MILPLRHKTQFWERMRLQVDIPDVRIHDLRHTFASLLVSGGASLEMIGRLLGHTQIGNTQRYAHLIDAPLRAVVNAVGEMLKPRLRVVGKGETASARSSVA
jgi:site-specific recombinase XerD